MVEAVAGKIRFSFEGLSQYGRQATTWVEGEARKGTMTSFSDLPSSVGGSVFGDSSINRLRWSGFHNGSWVYLWRGRLVQSRFLFLSPVPFQGRHGTRRGGRGFRF